MAALSAGDNQNFGDADRFRINELIDLDRYPVDRPDSEPGQELIDRCRENLATDACAPLPGFIRSTAIPVLAEQAQSLIDQAHRYDQPRPAFIEHPGHNYRTDSDDQWAGLRSTLFANRYYQVLNYHIPNNSDLRAIYLWASLTEFVRRVLGMQTLYTSQCPHLALTMKIAFEGDEDGWHYDPNDGVITLALQSPDDGGEFEYAPYIRGETDENYAGVKRLFDSPDTEARRVRLEPGTFTLFNGRRSMHRVRRVGASQRPRIVAIFSYDRRPDMVFSQNYIDLVRSFPQGRPDHNRCGIPES